MAELLSVSGLRAGYGASVVLSDIGFGLGVGDSLSLLGRNGVGKTTLLRSLMGLTSHHGGQIRLRGRAIETLPTHRRAGAGLGWVPQERGMFPSLTVEEHLTVAARPGSWTLARVYGMFPRLRERRANLGNQLSGGEQQMLAIGRALMTNPALLMLDEPMEGLAPVVVQELSAIIEALVQEGELSLIVVEQHARLALKLTKNVLVLDRGTIVYEGRSMELLEDADALHRLIAVT